MIQTYFLPPMRKVYQTTLTASAQTIELAYAYSKEKKYRIEMFHEMGAANATVSLYANTDTTATNYYTEVVTFDNAAVSATRNNTAAIASPRANDDQFYTIDFGTLADDTFVAHVNTARDAASAILARLAWLRSVNTFASLTKVTISAAQADTFLAGTIVRVYEYD